MVPGQGLSWPADVGLGLKSRARDAKEAGCWPSSSLQHSQNLSMCSSGESGLPPSWWPQDTQILTRLAADTRGRILTNQNLRRLPFMTSS